MSQSRRYRTLAVLVVATVALLGLDMSRHGSTSFLRTGAAGAFGPLERVLTVSVEDDVTRLTRERDDLERQRQQYAASLRQAREVTSVLTSPAARDVTLLAARVVGFAHASSQSGERRVTIDVGSRDGVTKDLTVIAGAGLVGRVVSVAAWTSDVLVVGDRELTVGVRVGSRGLLGSVTAKPSVAGRSQVQGWSLRATGRLSLTLLEQGTVVAGDQVTTLGSVSGRPFMPDIPLGTVVSVDSDIGQLTSTASVKPLVDAAALDVVAVILSSERTVPRTPAIGPAK